MANNVENILTVNGDGNELENIKAALRGPNGEIDFRSIAPETTIETWGTRRNAYQGKQDFPVEWTENTITFYTAWSPPDPIILKLSEQFPSHTFVLQSYDFQLPFAAVSTYIDGEVGPSIYCDLGNFHEVNDFCRKLHDAVSFVAAEIIGSVKNSMESKREVA